MDFMNQFNDANAQATFTAEEVKKNQIFCVLAYFSILFFLPYVVDKNSAYAKFHANQAFAYFLASLAVGVVCGILIFIPFLGGLWAPEQQWFPEYVHGFYEKDNLDIFITSGLSSNKKLLPRFNNPAEIVSLTLLGE